MKIKVFLNLKESYIPKYKYIYQNKLPQDRKISFHLLVKVANCFLSFFNMKFHKMYYYKIDLGFFKTLRLMFCCCKFNTKQHYQEYNIALKELLNYIHYTQFSKFFMDIEKIKGNLKKNYISEKMI